jgi:hypothetical protein
LKPIPSRIQTIYHTTKIDKKILFTSPTKPFVKLKFHETELQVKVTQATAGEFKVHAAEFDLNERILNIPIFKQNRPLRVDPGTRSLGIVFRKLSAFF